MQVFSDRYKAADTYTWQLTPRASPAQALDLHIAAECFMREFWDLVQYPVRMPPDMEQRFEDFGVKGGQDMPHCAHLPDSTRICFVRANEVRRAGQWIYCC